MVAPVQFPKVGNIQSPQSREVPGQLGRAENEGPSRFERVLSGALEEVDTAIKSVDGTTEDFLLGKTGIHEMALSLEQADLSLRLLTRIRNRIIEAYREISRMNV